MELTGFDVRYQKTVCKQSICIGCRQIEDCADAIKYTTNTLKDRLVGKITHDELMETYNNRFGVKEKDTLHWTELIGDQKNMFITIAKLPADSQAKTISELNDEAKQVYMDRLATLNYYGWFAPYMEGNELKFKTIHGKTQVKGALYDQRRHRLSIHRG